MDQKKKILLVEDELFIRELYQRTLEQAGYQVITALDGEQALTAVREKPDLVLLDIMLPKIHGIDVLKRIREDPEIKDTLVVLLTNLGQENIIKEAFNLGVKGYLMKMNLTPYDVVTQVTNLLKTKDNPALTGQKT